MTLVKLNNRPTRTIDNFIDSWIAGFPSASEQTQRSFNPAANIYETKDAFEIELNVAGRKKEDFSVNIEQNLLTISAENLASGNPEERKSIRKEFNAGSFKRSFTIDETIDASKIEARYENGLLKFTLPKKAEQKPEVVKIAIQ